jgi:hypothetical protein
VCCLPAEWSALLVVDLTRSLPAPLTETRGCGAVILHQEQANIVLWHVSHAFELPLRGLSELNGVQDFERIRHLSTLGLQVPFEDAQRVVSSSPGFDDLNPGSQVEDLSPRGGFLQTAAVTGATSWHSVLIGNLANVAAKRMSLGAGSASSQIRSKVLAEFGIDTWFDLYMLLNSCRRTVLPDHEVSMMVSAVE